MLRPWGTFWVNIGDSYAGSGKGQNKGGVPSDKAGELNRHNVGSMMGNLSKTGGAKDKDALLIPFRLALALQADGWYVRSPIVWHKPAGMPFSGNGWRWERCKVKVKGAGLDWRKIAASKSGPTASDTPCHVAGGNTGFAHKAEFRDCKGCPKCSKTDGYVFRKGAWRPTNTYEHIFMLAKSPQYFCDREAVATEAKESSKARAKRAVGFHKYVDNPNAAGPGAGNGPRENDPTRPVAAKANLRDVWKESTGFIFGLDESGNAKITGTFDTLMALVEKAHAFDGIEELSDVWTMNTASYRGGHYATFPMELPLTCIKAGTSEKGICSACGMPVVRVVERTNDWHGNTKARTGGAKLSEPTKETARGNLVSRVPEYVGPDTHTVAWRPACSCGAPTKPAVILDCFSGAGTTGLACRALGREYIGIELNEKYAKASEDRIARMDVRGMPDKEIKGGMF